MGIGLDDLKVPDRLPPGLGDGGRGPRRELTRRQLIGAGVGGALGLAGLGLGLGLGPGTDSRSGSARATAALPADGTALAFQSRPDLHPTVSRLQVAGRQAPGLTLLGPTRSAPVQAGATMLDERGELVWFSPLADTHDWLANLRTATLHGQPVLTWWQGRLDGGYGSGEAIIADAAYRPLHRVRAAGGRTMDVHEFILTDAGTALFTCTPVHVRRDLTALGGPAAATVVECIIQEVDVASGRLIREWRSLDHVAPEESYWTSFHPFDYLHVNSIDVLPGGDLLVSARCTWCVYRIDRASGAVIERIGGKRSDYAMAGDAQYAWQHDARWAGSGQMTIFDDGFDGVTRTHSRSRGLLLDVDARARRVRVARAVVSPRGLLTPAMGSTQLLGDGHLLVGLGDLADAYEFDAAGRVVATLQMPNGQHSYRVLREAWEGSPTRAPDVAVRRFSGRATLYASFNGATRLAGWRVLGGPRASDLRPVARARRSGFETAVGLGAESGVAVAVALDDRGRELGRSAPVRV